MISSCRVILLILCGGLAAYSSPARAQTGLNSPPIPPSGQLVDLDGWRLHLHCMGEARAEQPTVILEAGAGGFSVDWSLVQPEVARFARICSYDRAGLGWSELGPHPRTLLQVVWELHALLQKADVQPPYVLVGHSYGGILARLYTFTYPSDVTALVLDESGHERGVAVLRDGQLVRLVETATGRPVPEVKTSGPLRESDLSPAIRAQIEAAARSMASRALGPPRDKLPQDAQRMRAWAFAQVKHWAANDNPFEAEELAALLARWTGTAYPLGDMPVIVLSRGRPDPDEAQEEEHQANQVELLGLSRSARQIIAHRSGHQILLEEPELVVAAIREVVSITRR